jgi:hypothetical protein
MIIIKSSTSPIIPTMGMVKFAVFIAALGPVSASTSFWLVYATVFRKQGHRWDE